MISFPKPRHLLHVPILAKDPVCIIFGIELLYLTNLSFHQLFKRGINYPMESAVLAHSLFKSKLKYVPTQNIQNAEIYYFGKYHMDVNHSRLQLWCSCLTSHLVTIGVADSPVCICDNDGENTIRIM